MGRKLPQWSQILIAMTLGVGAGHLVFTSYSNGEAEKIAGYFSLLSDVFLRLIKMLIVPLVFSTLVVGIAHMGDAKSVGSFFQSLWLVRNCLCSPGQAHDAREGRQLLNRLGPTDRPLYLLMDRAYEGDETRQLALELGFVPVVPPKSNRINVWEYDREMYKRRNEILSPINQSRDEFQGNNNLLRE